MKLELDLARLGRLFPAFLLVDRNGIVLAVGPVVARHCPTSPIGQPYGTLFAAEHPREPDLAALAQSGDDLQLTCRALGIGMRGSVLAAGECFLLAMNVVLSSLDLDDSRLQISDFAPSDPLVQGLMLMRLQKAMLEESRESAQDLLRARQRSQELLDRISRAAGYMAHDFNNFLSIIKLNGDRLLDSAEFGDAQRRMVRIIMEVADRGSAITRSLMTLSHQKHDSRMPLMLDHLIRDNLAFLSSMAGARVDVTIDLGAPGLPVNVSRTGMMNCLVNLVVNSRDAMAGGGTITIATRVKDVALDGGAPRRHIAIRLSDSGPGMSPSVLSRAFEPLFSTKPHGSGIGLASVLEFAREMGGDACLDSRPGEGASVYIYLPAGHAGDWMMPEPVAARPPVALRHGARVLVVEDEPYALEALVELVEGMGHAVSAAPDAAAAMDILRAGPCDLLLTDVVLPGASGMELAAQAESEHHGLQVILMSGYVPEDETLRPGWSFVRKPLDTTRLREMIAEKLRG